MNNENQSQAIAKFDKVMAEYMEEVSSSDHKDFDNIKKLEEKRAPKIDKAEKVMQKELEVELEKENENLVKEQEASRKELTDLEEADEKDLGEKFHLYIAGMTAKQIARKYKAKDVKSYAKSLGLKTTGKEQVVAQRILDHHNS